MENKKGRLHEPIKAVPSEKRNKPLVSEEELEAMVKASGAKEETPE